MTHVTNMEEQPPLRARIMYQAIKLTTGDRNKQYGEPVQNMQDIAMLWDAYIKAKTGIVINLNGEDVAHMCSLMKIARSFNPGPAHPDNYVDSACYQAIAGECAEAERK